MDNRHLWKGRERLKQDNKPNQKIIIQKNFLKLKKIYIYVYVCVCVYLQPHIERVYYVSESIDPERPWHMLVKLLGFEEKEKNPLGI